jgi:hypothetical protein
MTENEISKIIVQAGAGLFAMSQPPENPLRALRPLREKNSWRRFRAKGAEDAKEEI